MSALEVLLLAGAAVLVLGRWAPASVRRPVTVAAAALTVAAGTALAVTGPRWQLLPVLAGAAIGLPLAAGGLRPPGRPAPRARRWLAVAGTAACLGLLAAGPAAAWAFPEPAFPDPSGPYRVGTEELASRGCVVAALDHPYDSATVVLADGRAVATRLRATGDPGDDERRAAGWTATRAADLSFALTQLGLLDRGELPSPLRGRLDTDRAAATGHSLGGAAALQAVRQDPRFDAAVDIDGFPHDPAPRAFRQPVLALTAGIDPADRGQAERYAIRLAQVLELSAAPSYRLTVPGAAHLTFTDAPLYLPLVPALTGSLGRSAGPAVTAAATAAFLDTTLRGHPGALAAELARYGDLTAYHR